MNIEKIYRLLRGYRPKFNNVSEVVYEDIVQDTMIDILQKGKNNKNIEAFAYILLKNKFINHYRKYKDKKFVSSDLIPDVQVTHREDTSELRKMILKIKRRDERACLLLRYRGLKYHEIADSLNMNISTVKTWIRKGKQKIKTQAYENV